MSQSSLSSETQISASESTKTSLSLAQPVSIQKQQQLRKENLDKDIKRKKLVWGKKDRLQLQLHLNQRPDIRQQGAQSTLVVTSPVFSPLCLRKHLQSSCATSPLAQQSQGKNRTTISLSAKYAYHFFPAISVTDSVSPFTITTASAKRATFNSNYGKISSVNSSSQRNPYNGKNLNSSYSNSNSNGNLHGKQSCYKNDYSNNYIHSGTLPFKYIRNSKQQVEGYPKLQRLYKLKEQQVEKYSTRPYGARIDTDNLAKTLNSWVYDHDLQFDVIMIGALTENQLIYPLLTKLPIDKLCSKPGFLFIWASTKKISELSTLLNDSRTWAKKFRRSEELVFIPVDKNSVYYPKEWSIPEEQILEEVQWHCWMCITGTVRRSTDKDIIHCNVNTDLSLENSSTGNSAVPAQIYKVVENFSSSTRRLHIIPTSTGLKKHVKVRPGWVIVSPDIILDNFDPERYKKDIEAIGSKIPYNDEIEQLRPKTPV